MKLMLSLFFLAAMAAVHGQNLGYFPIGYFPIPYGFPYGYFPSEDVYAASLGGASVGLYGKSQPYGLGFPGFPYGGSSDVNAASLGGAEVGLYGRDRYY